MEQEEIKHLASLSRIRLADDEAKSLNADIDAVLQYVSVVNELTADEGVTKKVGAVYNVFREDEASNTPGAHTEDLLGQAPQRSGDFLKVKKILDQD